VLFSALTTRRTAYAVPVDEQLRFDEAENVIKV